MSFDILTALRPIAGDLPAATETPVPSLLAPSVPNVDADGGMHSIAEGFDPLNRDETVTVK